MRNAVGLGPQVSIVCFSSALYRGYKASRRLRAGYRSVFELMINPSKLLWWYLLFQMFSSDIEAYGSDPEVEESSPVSTFDPTACAQLHNEIVRRAAALDPTLDSILQEDVLAIPDQPLHHP